MATELADACQFAERGILSRPDLARPLSTTGLRPALRGRAGRIALTERLPGESKKGLPSGGIGCFEINDLGQRNADRIALLNVTRVSASI